MAINSGPSKEVNENTHVLISNGLPVELLNSKMMQKDLGMSSGVATESQSFSILAPNKSGPRD